jgi:GR25 family glycosyltransferase involved in LPS biosynthesis
MFVGVFYINLDHRTDRKEEIERDLTSMDLPFERFSAIKTTPGAIGCGQSHLAVLKEAKKRGYANVLIFEDDFQFLTSKEEFYSYMTTFLQTHAEYDIIMLSYALNKSHAEGNYLRVEDAQTASGYLVHSRFYDTLIDNFEEASAGLQDGRLQHWIYAVDQYWKRLQPHSLWYAANPRLGKQRPSISDNGLTPEFTDYDC